MSFIIEKNGSLLTVTCSCGWAAVDPNTSIIHRKVSLHSQVHINEKGAK
jgi:hypothetical protein